MSRRRPRVGIALLVAAMLLAGCQDETDSGGDDLQGSSEAVDDRDEPDQTTGVDDGDDGGADASDAPVEELRPRLSLPDVGELVLETPTEDVGPFPTLRWQAVPDAHRYHISVIDSDGRAMWAWTTSNTEVILGGYEQPPPEHVRGPRLHASMHWYVLARDVDDQVLAQSGLRPIAP